MRRRIVLLGATGYTGQRVLRELLARDEEPTLIGRNPGQDAGGRGALRGGPAGGRGGRHLGRPMSPGCWTQTTWSSRTVGPFMRLGSATATAAAEAGAHYLDSTGEGSFVRRVVRTRLRAAARGATMVPAFGYDYVPGNLAGALALTRAGERASRIEVGYFITRSGNGDELRYRSTLRDTFRLSTGGTRATLVGGAADDAFAFRRPRPGGPAVLVDERAGKARADLRLRRRASLGDEPRHIRTFRVAGGLPPSGQRRRRPRLAWTLDAPDPDRRHAQCSAPAIGRRYEQA